MGICIQTIAASAGMKIDADEATHADHLGPLTIKKFARSVGGMNNVSVDIVLDNGELIFNGPGRVFAKGRRI